MTRQLSGPEVHVLRVCAEQLENYSFHEYGKALRSIAARFESSDETPLKRYNFCTNESPHIRERSEGVWVRYDDIKYLLPSSVKSKADFLACPECTADPQLGIPHSSTCSRRTSLCAPQGEGVQGSPSPHSAVGQNAMPNSPVIVHMGSDSRTPHKGLRSDCAICVQHKPWCQSLINQLPASSLCTCGAINGPGGGVL